MTNIEKKKKFKISFPSAFTVLFIVLFLAAVLTYVVPAGSYDKLTYNGDAKVFTITHPDGKEDSLPATKETLKKLGVVSPLEKFENGDIYKPIGIPNTYQQVPQQPQDFKAFVQAPIKGVYDVVDIILFVLVLGGFIGLLDYSGAFSAGIAGLSRITRGKEYLIIVFLTFLIALGGTTFGMCEETIALYPILVPVFLAMQYDAIVCIAAIYMGSCIGTMFSTVNPFSAVIASNAAGIDFTQGLYFRLFGLVVGIIITAAYITRYANKVKKDPINSIIYEDKERLESKFGKDVSNAPPLKASYIISLLLFVGSFGVMVYGVKEKGWWFEEMTALFLVSGVIAGIILGISLKIPEKVLVSKYVEGASGLVGVALVVGIARAVNIILDNGKVSDTILNSLTNSVVGMNPYVFIILTMAIFFVLGFFINSSSGLAVLAIPIVAPLADSVGLSRDVIISAYLYGLGIISFVTPTGLVLATLDLVEVSYDKWLKFALPLMVILSAFAVILLLVQTAFSGIA